MKTIDPINLDQRACGILLHPTSLPGAHGVGDLGAAATQFVDFLKQSGQRWWQMFPLGPVGYGNSPYHTLSAFAGNPLLIDLEALLHYKLLNKNDFQSGEPLRADRVDYERVSAYKRALLRRAYQNFKKKPALKIKEECAGFCRQNRSWLTNYSHYNALKEHFHGAPWWAWDPPIRDRRRQPLRTLLRNLKEEVKFYQFVQYLFQSQWEILRRRLRDNGIGLIGDVPIFVAPDSADVWAHRDIFRLDSKGRPRVMAGVPPDCFSPTGQLWGNPVYRWETLEKTGYKWWIERLRRAFHLFDVVRLDHFIGFTRYWAVPRGHQDARVGSWKKGPGAKLFSDVLKALPQAKIIAEDLGSVTPEVEALREQFGFPGMKVLQFAFETHPGAEINRPYHFVKNSFVYTGTHDNDTMKGWFNSLTKTSRKKFILRYLNSDGRQIHWDMIREALKTSANNVIVPLQDILGMGSEGRINKPGTRSGNWEWRFPKEALTKKLAEKLLQLTATYGRLGEK